MKTKKTKTLKRWGREPLNCRVKPSTIDLIRVVAKRRDTSLGRAVDYLASAAAITIKAMDKITSEEGL